MRKHSKGGRPVGSWPWSWFILTIGLCFVLSSVSFDSGGVQASIFRKRDASDEDSKARVGRGATTQTIKKELKDDADDVGDKDGKASDDGKPRGAEVPATDEASSDGKPRGGEVSATDEASGDGKSRGDDAPASNEAKEEGKPRAGEVPASEEAKDAGKPRGAEVASTDEAEGDGKPRGGEAPASDDGKPRGADVPASDEAKDDGKPRGGEVSTSDGAESRAGDTPDESSAGSRADRAASNKESEGEQRSSVDGDGKERAGDISPDQNGQNKTGDASDGSRHYKFNAGENPTVELGLSPDNKITLPLPKWLFGRNKPTTKSPKQWPDKSKQVKFDPRYAAYVKDVKRALDMGLRAVMYTPDKFYKLFDKKTGQDKWVRTLMEKVDVSELTFKDEADMNNAKRIIAEINRIARKNLRDLKIDFKPTTTTKKPTTPKPKEKGKITFDRATVSLITQVRALKRELERNKLCMCALTRDERNILNSLFDDKTGRLKTREFTKRTELDKFTSTIKTIKTKLTAFKRLHEPSNVAKLTGKINELVQVLITLDRYHIKLRGLTREEENVLYRVYDKHFKKQKMPRFITQKDFDHLMTVVTRILSKAQAGNPTPKPTTPKPTTTSKKPVVSTTPKPIRTTPKPTKLEFSATTRAEIARLTSVLVSLNVDKIDYKKTLSREQWGVLQRVIDFNGMVLKQVKFKSKEDLKWVSYIITTLRGPLEKLRQEKAARQKTTTLKPGQARSLNTTIMEKVTGIYKLRRILELNHISLDTLTPFERHALAMVMDLEKKEIKKPVFYNDEELDMFINILVTVERKIEQLKKKLPKKPVVEDERKSLNQTVLQDLQRMLQIKLVLNSDNSVPEEANLTQEELEVFKQVFDPKNNQVKLRTFATQAEMDRFARIINSMGAKFRKLAEEDDSSSQEHITQSETTTMFHVSSSSTKVNQKQKGSRSGEIDDDGDQDEEEEASADD